MRSARLGLALSVLLALTGTAVAVERGTAPRANAQVATLAASVPVAPSTTSQAPPLACHDQPVAAQAAGSSVTVPLKPRTATPTVAAVPTTTTVPPPIGAAAPSELVGGCHPTPEQIAAAQKLVDDTKAAVSGRYSSVSRATLDGFQPQSNDDSAHTRVMHYISQANQRDGRTPDPNAPEGLLYGRTDRHGLVLLGAFYVTDAGQAGPDIGGCLTPWHVHSPGAPAMLHVWTVDVPGGPYAADVDANYIASL